MKKKILPEIKITKKTVITIVIWAVAAGFAAYLVVRLLPKNETDKTQFTYYSFTGEAGKQNDTLENDDLLFTLDPETTGFEVLQKATGHIWKSNPEETDSDPIALPKEKACMHSTLILTYSTENGVNNTYDSKTYSVDRRFYSIENEENEITVNYIFGDMERQYIIPMAVDEDRMDEITGGMSKSNINLILQYYRLYDTDNLLPSDNMDELLRNYPVLDEKNLYVVRDDVPDYMKKKIEKFFADNGYTYSDYEKDMELYAEGAKKSVPMFNVSVIYKLDGKNLVVEVPFDKISFKKDFPLVELAVLPYFGAGSADESGYMFVPEGGGSIIKFNNGRLKQSNYYSDIYGWDYCSNRKAVVTETRNLFPVFGIAAQDSSFISILEDGASYAGISADISGRYNDVNYVYAKYSMAHSEEYDISSKSTNSEFVYEKRLPAGEKIRQLYSFVPSSYYNNMAAAYRDYLVKKNSLTGKNEKSAPVAVEILGAVDKIQQVAGFPKSRPLRITSYEQTEEIINELKTAGFTNMYVKLTGFFNGGIKQKVLKNVKFLQILGGKKGFVKMAESLTGVRLYLDGITQFAVNSGYGNGFMSYRDSARFVSSELAKRYDYSRIWYGKKKTEKPQYLLRPLLADKMMMNLEKTAQKYGLYGVSLRDTGYMLSGNYDPDYVISRESVRKRHIAGMQKIKNNRTGIMINGGNDYALQYADFVTNMDFTGHAYSIIDEQIPFYQMALHGYVNYSGIPVNLAPDSRYAVLKAAEYGAGLMFVFMAADEGKLQDTSYSVYYGAGFREWGASAEQIYSRYNRELGKTFSQKMVNHRNLSPDVSLTEYEDGTKVYVNFGYTDYISGDGIKIRSQDYKVVNAHKGN